MDSSQSYNCPKVAYTEINISPEASVERPVMENTIAVIRTVQVAKYWFGNLLMETEDGQFESHQAQQSALRPNTTPLPAISYVLQPSYADFCG